jgi:Geranylgeranyl pyrophosphate synthase
MLRNATTAAPPTGSDLQDTPKGIALHLAAELSALNSRLRQTLTSGVPLVNTVADYIVSAGGKRLRPVLIFLVCEALSGRRSGPLAVDLAAIVELIHTATLLHDDVVDESKLRRGRASANAMFGNAASVLVGDFLYSRSFQVMVGTGEPRVLDILAEATNRIAEGEVMQLMAIGRLDLTIEEYMQVIDAKTAKLFEAAGALGALAAGAGPADEARMADYARHLGVAFQIADDVLDYRGETRSLGKSLGDDLAEGKLTLPIIVALERADAATRTRLARILTRNREHHAEHDNSDLPAVRQDLESCGALQVSLAYASRAADQAEAIAQSLPASTARDWMLRLCRYAIDRDH